MTDRWKTVIKKDDLFKQLAFSSFRLFSHSTTGNTTVGESTRVWAELLRIRASEATSTNKAGAKSLRP